MGGLCICLLFLIFICVLIIFSHVLQLSSSQEEAYLREAIKASLETEAKRKEGSDKAEGAPKISAEATDLLIDFMDDFDATG